MSIADQFQKSSFGDLIFPVETHTVHGHGDHYIHKYWKSPGGAPEKGGRGLWNFTIHVVFDAKMKAYPGLYPDTMNKLRALYEIQATRDFVHPTIGSFPAFPVDWRQVKSGKHTSGERVDVEFLEDQQELFVASLLVTNDLGDLPTTADELSAQLFQVIAQLNLGKNDQSLFDALQGAVNAVVAVRDTSQMYGNLVAAKCEQVMGLCQQIDSLASMQDARAYPVNNAVRDVWLAAHNIHEDLMSKRVPLQTWTVPSVMTISGLSIALYQDTSRQDDLMALNLLPTPERIPAGTLIRFYPATT